MRRGDGGSGQDTSRPGAGAPGVGGGCATGLPWLINRRCAAGVHYSGRGDTTHPRAAPGAEAELADCAARWGRRRRRGKRSLRRDGPDGAGSGAEAEIGRDEPDGEGMRRGVCGSDAACRGRGCGKAGLCFDRWRDAGSLGQKRTLVRHRRGWRRAALPHGRASYRDGRAPRPGRDAGATGGRDHGRSEAEFETGWTGCRKDGSPGAGIRSKSLVCGSDYSPLPVALQSLSRSSSAWSACRRSWSWSWRSIAAESSASEPSMLACFRATWTW